MRSSQAKQLLALFQEGFVPLSWLSKALREALLADGVIRIQKKGAGYRALLLSQTHLKNYLHHDDPKSYLEGIIASKSSDDKAVLVDAGLSSKKSSKKWLNGLFLAAVEPVKVELNGKALHIETVLGSACFIHEAIESFKMSSKDTVVVIVENSENLLQIVRYRRLFDANKAHLFIYRQRVQKILPFIENELIYFGDIDIPAIAIYEREIVPFVKHENHRFFIPKNLEALLHNQTRFSAQHQLYLKQEQSFLEYKSTSAYLQRLIERLREARQSIEQEGLI